MNCALGDDVITYVKDVGQRLKSEAGLMNDGCYVRACNNM